MDSYCLEKKNLINIRRITYIIIIKFRITIKFDFIDGDYDRFKRYDNN
jgi:hypothetical protein